MSFKKFQLTALALALALGAWACSGSEKVVQLTDQDLNENEAAENENAETDVEAAQCSMYEDCPAVNDCRDGKCQRAILCITSNSECLEDEICDKRPWEANGYCRKFCTTDLTCPSDGWCLNGVCRKYETFDTGTPLKTGTEAKTKLKAGFGKAPLDYPFGVSLGGYGTRKGPSSPYANKMGGSTGAYERPYVKALNLDNGKDSIIFVRLPMIFGTDYMATEVIKQVAKATGKDITRHLVMSATHTHSNPARFWTILPGKGFGALGLDEFNYEIFLRLSTSIAAAVIESMKEENMKNAAFGYAIDPDYDADNKVAHDRRHENNPLDCPKDPSDPKYCDPAKGTKCNCGYKDPRMTVMRIDDWSDANNKKPMAVLINFAAHGTIDDVVDTFSTQDTGGGVEFMFQKNFEAETGKHIEAAFLQGMAGDVSPGGGEYGHSHQLQMQKVGDNAYPKAKALYDKIVVSDDVDMKIITKRIPIDREAVGYTDKQFFSYDIIVEGCKALKLEGEACTSANQDEVIDAACDAIEKESGMPVSYCMNSCLYEIPPYGNIRFGGFQCSMATAEDDDLYETRIWDGCLGCILKMEPLNYGVMPEFSKTRLSAILIQDLAITVLPGEPSSMMGTIFVNEIVEDIKKQKGKDVNALILGYSNDHHFYLMVDDDYYQGGYNTTMSVWGPAFGRYLINSGKSLLLQLFDDGYPDTSNNLKAPNYPKAYLEAIMTAVKEPMWRVPDATDAAVAGKMVVQPPTKYERMKKFRIKWTGGDPGVDYPEIILQKKNAATQEFENVITPTGRLYNAGMFYNIKLEWDNLCLNSQFYPDCEADEVNINNFYVTFEETKDFAEGSYRFLIKGRYYTGTDANTMENDKIKTYEITTDPFEVASANLIVHDLAYDAAGKKITGGFSYPSGPTTDPGVGEPFTKLEQAGAVLHFLFTPATLGALVPAADITEAKITFTYGTDSTKEVAITPTTGESKRKVVKSRKIENNLPVEEFDTFGDRLWPATLFSVDVPAEVTLPATAKIEFKDKYGNAGTAAIELQ